MKPRLLIRVKRFILRARTLSGRRNLIPEYCRNNATYMTRFLCSADRYKAAFLSARQTHLKITGLLMYSRKNIRLVLVLAREIVTHRCS